MGSRNVHFCNPVRPVEKAVRVGGKGLPRGEAHIYLGKTRLSLILRDGYSSPHTSRHAHARAPACLYGCFYFSWGPCGCRITITQKKTPPFPIPLFFNNACVLFYFGSEGRIKEGLTDTGRHNLRVRDPESRGRNPGINAEGYYDHLAILRSVVWRH